MKTPTCNSNLKSRLYVLAVLPDVTQRKVKTAASWSLPLPLPLPLYLFVMPDEVPQSVPLVTLSIDITHTTPQAGLQILGVVPEQPHDHAPADAGEDGPGVVAHAGAEGLPRDQGEGEGGPLLDAQAGEGEDDAGKDVNDNLLVDARDLARARTSAKDEVAA